MAPGRLMKASSCSMRYPASLENPVLLGFWANCFEVQTATERSISSTPPQSNILPSKAATSTTKQPTGLCRPPNFPSQATGLLAESGRLLGSGSILPSLGVPRLVLAFAWSKSKQAGKQKGTRLGRQTSKAEKQAGREAPCQPKSTIAPINSEKCCRPATLGPRSRAKSSRHHSASFAIQIPGICGHKVRVF